MSMETRNDEAMAGDGAPLPAEGDLTAEGAPATAPVPRSARRPRRRGWLLRRPRRLVALVIGVLLVLGWLAYASPVTLVKHVVVTAPRGISEESLRLASGISATDHVPAVDAARVRDAIMQTLPAVADVQVERSLPDTVRLVVTARTALAAVAAGKGFYLMDSDGILYDKVGSAKGVPVIRAGSDTGRDTARSVLLSLPDDLRTRVKSISAKTTDDVRLELRGGAKVVWGSVQDAELKAKVLDGLVSMKADTYDVSAPLLPTTTGGKVAEAQ